MQPGVLISTVLAGGDSVVDGNKRANRDGDSEPRSSRAPFAVLVHQLSAPSLPVATVDGTWSSADVTLSPLHHYCTLRTAAVLLPPRDTACRVSKGRIETGCRRGRSAEADGCCHLTPFDDGPVASIQDSPLHAVHPVRLVRTSMDRANVGHEVPRPVYLIDNKPPRLATRDYPHLEPPHGSSSPSTTSNIASVAVDMEATLAGSGLG